MAVTTRDDKQTMDPPMQYEVEIGGSKDDDVIDNEREFDNVTEKVFAVTEKVVPIPWPPPLFPKKLAKKTKKRKISQVHCYAKQLSINVMLIESLKQNHGSAKFMKHIVTKKRSMSFEDDKKLQHHNAIAIVYLVKKKNNHGSFTIPCTIELLYFDKALCDLGASINLIPLSIYKKLGLGDDDVPIKVESYIYLANFVIIHFEVHFEVPIILWETIPCHGECFGWHEESIYEVKT